MNLREADKVSSIARVTEPQSAPADGEPLPDELPLADGTQESDGSADTATD